MLFLITSISPETFQNILILLATEENVSQVIKIRPGDLSLTKQQMFKSFQHFISFPSILNTSARFVFFWLTSRPWIENSRHRLHSIPWSDSVSLNTTEEYFRLNRDWIWIGQDLLKWKWQGFHSYCDCFNIVIKLEA